MRSVLGLIIKPEFIFTNCRIFFSSQSKKYACVTGASSGIGKAYAERLALLDYHLFLIQRSQPISELLQSKSQDISIIKSDLTNADQLQQIYKLILEQTKQQPPDIFINNAGNSVLSPIHFQSLSEIQKQVNLHIVSTTFLSSLYLKSVIETIQSNPQLRADKIFTLINTSSINAQFNPSFLSVYNSCKSYIKSFSDSLAKQVGDQSYQRNIRVICTMPGPIDTKMMKGIEVQKQGLLITPQTHVINVLKQLEQREGSFITFGSKVHEKQLERFKTGQSDIENIFTSLKQKVLPFFQKRKRGITNL